jgi:hypothetical protein
MSSWLSPAFWPGELTDDGHKLCLVLMNRLLLLLLLLLY